MANALYTLFKEGLLKADYDLEGSNIKAVLVDAADYTVNLATDNALDDIAAGARVATSANLGTKTFTGGTFDCADFTWSAVTGDPSEAVVLYVDSGVESTSLLIAYFDTGTGLPVTPNGGDIDLAVNGSGWFSL